MHAPEPGAVEAAHAGFPVSLVGGIGSAGGAELSDGVSRRSFIKLLGASAALAGLGACMREPAEQILPYTTRPPEVTPGIPLHYATSMTIDGYATGLLVESHEGRPTKVEGNPEHPASLGATGVYEQASVLQLYDPHRARVFRASGHPADWRAFVQAFGAGSALRGGAGNGRGTGLHFLLEPTSSPLVGELLDRVRERYPNAGIHFYAPLESATGLEAARAVLGRAVIPQHDFTRADVVLALDADFLDAMPFHLRYARQFADRRRVETPAAEMNRLYVVEGMLSTTGGIADHRLRTRAGDVQRVLAAILSEVLASGAAGATGTAGLPPGVSAEVVAALTPFRANRRESAHERRWVEAVARDLRAHAGRSIVIAGDRQPLVVHAMTMLLNAALDNVGGPVWYTTSPVLEAGEKSHDLAPLVEAMRSGAVDTLVIAGANPVYDAPADLELARWFERVRQRVYLGPYENETAQSCNWFAPAAHELEAWGDARAYDGTVSTIQPLIAPLYGGKTVSELLALFALGEDRSAYALLRDSWRARGAGSAGGTRAASRKEGRSATDGTASSTAGAAGASFEEFWASAVRRGVVSGTAFLGVSVTPRWTALPPLLAALAAPNAARATSGEASGGLEIAFERSARVYDGRFADNAWLQELPDPMTKITWDNAVLLSPRTARRLGVGSNDVVAIRLRGRSIHAPVFVLPGHADDAVTLPVGYGRDGAERVAQGVGVNAFSLRTSAAPYVDAGAVVTPVTGARHELATTQTHWRLEGRPVAQAITLDAYRQNPDFTRAQQGRVLSLYEPHRYDTGDQWAMAIDLGTCIGCGACAIACQAENNVPVVGRDGVLDRREMHWLRIDRYFTGPEDDPHVVAQPMLCQQCEKAPCEYVCPVNATVHSDDGLNEMVYNRCVGTRFCSNNCPYKVRRFNWFNYNAHVPETERMMMNPDVTVRARGVMEKCTFCVQRIRRAQIDAQLEGRSVRDGDVLTACQQACPTRAIVFGSYTDPESAIVRSLAIKRRYAALHELGTEPRVRYLARVTNPNPALMTPAGTEPDDTASTPDTGRPRDGSDENNNGAASGERDGDGAR
jgi:molybdopterin-containing oxidoreductase family iron-sulfur binding subunit